MTAMHEHSLERLNRTPVAPRELLEIVEQVETLQDSGTDAEEAGLALISTLYRREPTKALAISARIHALFRVLEHEAAQSWTLPHLPDGTIRTREEMIAAAALQPLTEAQGGFAFDVNAFLDRVLDLVEPEGHA